MRKYNIAVVGATGAVGEEIFRVLEEFKFPVNEILPLTSSRSAGMEIEFDSEVYKTQELKEDTFDKNEIDIAFFSAGAKVSAKYAPLAADSGALVIDNTSHFRMQDDIALVVPECNKEDIKMFKNSNIIANPNCSTIQMVQILKPLDDAFDIKRVDVSTYQATSGAGKEGMEELVKQLQAFFAFRLDECEGEVFPHQIAMNLFPHIDVFCENAYTKEEMKMVNETQKILHKNMQISATCVRVPVLRSHSEAITIKFNKEFDIEKVKEILKNAPGLVLCDDIENNIYPMPLVATDTNETFVGRIRRDIYDDKILHLWCSADQLRVGAATNAVKIALEWIKMQE